MERYPGASVPKTAGICSSDGENDVMVMASNSSDPLLGVGMGIAS